MVFPTPLGPQNKNACAKCLFLIAFFKVLVMDAWPITLSKVEGRYLRAETIKLSIIYSVKINEIKDNIYLHLPNYYLSLHPLIRNNFAMKKDIHPENYRFIVFKDVSCDHTFLTRSTAPTKETIKWTDGKEYPLIKLEISDKSHPFYTGKMKLVDTAGRVDKFKSRFTKVREDQANIREAKIEELRAAQAEAQKEAAARKEAEMIAAEKQAEEAENAPDSTDDTAAEDATTDVAVAEEAVAEEAVAEEAVAEEAVAEEAVAEEAVAEEAVAEEAVAEEAVAEEAVAEDVSNEDSLDETAAEAEETEESKTEESPAEEEPAKGNEEAASDEETKE